MYGISLLIQIKMSKDKLQKNRPLIRFHNVKLIMFRNSIWSFYQKRRKERRSSIQVTFTCSKSTIETLVKSKKCVQSYQ